MLECQSGSTFKKYWNYRMSMTTREPILGELGKKWRIIESKHEARLNLNNELKVCMHKGPTNVGNMRWPEMDTKINDVIRTRLFFHICFQSCKMPGTHSCRLVKLLSFLNMHSLALDRQPMTVRWWLDPCVLGFVTSRLRKCQQVFRFHHYITDKWIQRFRLATALILDCQINGHSGPRGTVPTLHKGYTQT